MTGKAQLGGSPARQYYAGGELARMHTIGDLRARAHRRMPRFVLEYLEGGAEDEATLARERDAFGEWRFMPRTLLDVANRSLTSDLLGQSVPLPMMIAPTGLNGVFRKGADVDLATAAAGAGIPFVQSTMSNALIEDVAAVTKLRHWFQLYVFGADKIWRSLVDRARAAKCEALVLTTNSQIFGNREWDERTRGANGKPSLATIVDAALHPPWLWQSLRHGMPVFVNVIDFVPEEQRSFFASACGSPEPCPTTAIAASARGSRSRWRRRNAALQAQNR